jgi:hypothetical protein
VARNGPADDFHNQRTQNRIYGGLGGPPPPDEPAAEENAADQAGPPEAVDPFDQEAEPTPWYRKPVGIIAWVLAVLILIALIVYGLMELIQGPQGTGHTPSTTSSTTPTTTTAPTSSSEPPTTATTEPPTSRAVEPPAQQPTQQQQPTRQPTQQPPTHRHHLPSLPTVITIPEGPVVTLPPGF